MSFSHHYRRPSPDLDDDADSDADLTLEELDPAPVEIQSSYRPTFGRRPPEGRLELQDLRLNTQRVGRGKGKDKARKSQEEDLRGLLDNEHENNDSATTNSVDHEQLQRLSEGQARGRVASRNTARPSRWSTFLTKIRSSPRSEVEGEYDPSTNRLVAIGQRQVERFPPNLVSNAKYTPWSFLPRTLYNEFSFFFNMYFLLVALSQIIPQLRIGYLSTYIAPLAFVISITLGKEAWDDIQRRRRDAEANSEKFTVLSFNQDVLPKKNKTRKTRKAKQTNDDVSRLTDVEDEENELDSKGDPFDPPAFIEITKMSKDLKVGDVLKLGKDQRIPADAIILKSYVNETVLKSSHGDEESDGAGEAFIRTDQLDGETDWKLRLAPSLSQALNTNQLTGLTINASKPDKKVNDFVGTITLASPRSSNERASSTENTSVPLTIDNTAWANTVMASSATVLAAVVYTGPQTRQALSTSASRTKTGLLEYEINNLTKILCALTLVLSIVLVALGRYESPDEQVWYISAMRFLILFSTIIPISLRVNVDMGKSVYAWFIQRDSDIAGTVVRTSTIPEDLGRIEYLLSDKTGTLTQNDMQLKKVHVGTVSYANDAMAEVAAYVRQGFASAYSDASHLSNGSIAASTTTTRNRREIGSRVRDVVLALALCHNVTPTMAEENGENVLTYQASSPDEIAIVRWTEAVGLRLSARDRHNMVLQSPHTNQTVIRVEILNVFPFTSEGKRMGIILKFLDINDKPAEGSDESQAEPIWFFQKGADTVMSSIVASNDWLDEETANMAREGLRTLVVGRKKLSSQQYEDFSSKYKQAALSLHNRDESMASVVKNHLEHDLELLGVTGVEDKLQMDVKPSLELLRNAGVKIWMLTGDKVETARCVAVSSKLVARGQYVHTISKMSRKELAQDSLDFLRSKPDSCLLIDGESLALMLNHHREAFISTAVRLPTVVACRCSPTQKADVAALIRTYTKKRICCIGDGGNDVSMIQAADVGVGIVGKEGRQASLAADFSVTQFSHLTKLLVWHGRNSYKRSAKLAQFIIHRGLIISVAQTVFSLSKGSEPIALYRDWLLVGYATVYTMAPVFSLVLDTDIPPQLAHLYPELYAELSTSRSLSYRTFFIWVAISIYQGCGIQLLAQFLVPIHDDTDEKRMVSVSYTVLILNELVMVAAEITTWHWVMIVSIVGTACVYFGSIPFLGGYYDLAFVPTIGFWWRVAAISAVSLVPVYAAKLTRRLVKPPNYRKVQQGL